MDRVLAVPTALLQNPAMPTSTELARGMVMLEVMHYDFQGNMKAGRIIVHELVLNHIRQFFREAFMLRFPIHSVIPISEFEWCDGVSCAANNSSGHNMRYIEGTLSLLETLSKHSIGCAIDINPRQNPCFVLDEKTIELELMRIIPSDGIYVPGTPGTFQKGHPLVELMMSLGWAWGGNWTFPKDFHHFQIVPPELAHYMQ